MAWLRLDDGFDDHPKVAELTDGQAWRWVRVLLYCSRFETDGRVPAAVLKRLGLAGQRARLLELELLEERGGELFVHDFLEHNPSREDRERERERWREYQRSSRERRGVRGGHSRESGAESVPDSSSSAQERSPSPSPMESSTPTSEVDAASSSSSSAGVEGEGLTIGLELELARLLGLVGELDPQRVDYVRAAAGRLPESVTVGLLEYLTGPAGSSVRDRAGYVLGAYRTELERRGLR